MTYNEYLTRAGAYNPATIFQNIPAVFEKSFDDMFKKRFGARECFSDDVGTMADAVELYTLVNVHHFKPIIDAMNKANADLINNIKNRVTNYKAPDGVPDTAYAENMTETEIENAKGDAEQLQRYFATASKIYNELLRSFETLFIGVY